MNSRALLTGASILAASFSVAAPQGPHGFGPKKRLAVTDVEVTVSGGQTVRPVWDNESNAGVEPPPIPYDLGAGITDMLINELVKSGRYIVIDQTKAATADMQREKAIAGGQAAAGSPMSAQLSISGALSEFRWNRSSLSESLLDLYSRHEDGLGAVVRVDVKIIDLGTGQIFRTASAVGEGKGRTTSLTIGTKFTSSAFRDCPLGLAVNKAVSNAVADINRQDTEVAWEGRVADVVSDEGRGQEIYLNAGSTAGVKVGDEFEITRMTDSTRTHVGHVKVVRVESEISVASVTDGQGFAAGDAVTYVSKTK